MKRFIYQKCVELTNGKTTSSVLKAFTGSAYSKKIIPSYQKTFGIKMEEWEIPDKGFSSLQEFFTREVKRGARPISEDQNTLISPVDGKIEYAGPLASDGQYIVKGHSYTITDLLGSNAFAETFRNGYMIILYLSPANYHRIHSPVNASVGRQWIFGRSSYPVNHIGLSYGDRPLSKNYRMVTELVTEHEKKFAFIKVGAMFVNSIHLSNTDDKWRKGEEVGFFRFGSTVILVAEEGSIELTKKFGPVKMGEVIGQLRV
ncbi:phosphatidylserine decarboxylase [Jeotgalibacillus soli]|uniref:phosphatidylserine decarboxylase n=1 Tax=Jeotgalibacillus soli TaxID=889306 RepID=A0A0C2V676_9BACL|nr:phosphatidylserine decarboxylase [Jeotgalibacillus soli]KIL44482.1 phosphatidylserine darboxylase [Jeotgalibacillus soli]